MLRIISLLVIIQLNIMNIIVLKVTVIAYSSNNTTNDNADAACCRTARQSYIIYIYIYIYVHMYVCIYIYIHIFYICTCNDNNDKIISICMCVYIYIYTQHVILVSCPAARRAPPGTSVRSRSRSSRTPFFFLFVFSAKCISNSPSDQAHSAMNFGEK